MLEKFSRRRIHFEDNDKQQNDSARLRESRAFSFGKALGNERNDFGTDNHSEYQADLEFHLAKFQCTGFFLAQSRKRLSKVLAYMGDVRFSIYRRQVSP